MNTHSKIKTIPTLRTRIVAIALICASGSTLKPACGLDLGDGLPPDQTPMANISPFELFEQAWSVVQERNSDRSFNGQDWARWKQHYKGKLKTHLDACVAIDSMLASLEPRSHVRFAPVIGCGGWFPQGIGVSVRLDDQERVVVKSIYPSRGNCGLVQLRPGDVIYAVNGTPIQRYPQNLSRVIERMKGRPHSTVELTVLRDGQLRSFKQQRNFDLENVHGMLDNNIEYIKFNLLLGTSNNKVKEFDSSTSRAKGIIIDFRDTGGLETLSIAKSFCQSLEKKNYRKQIVLITNNETKGPAVAICNELQKQQSAILVGEQTNEISQGKNGTYVLEGGYFITFEMIRNSEDSALASIQAVHPDEEVKLSKADINNGKGPWWFTERELPRTERAVKDIQLKRAMQILRTSIGS